LQEYRVNRQIRAKEVRLIDENGKQIGIVPLQEALRIANEKGKLSKDVKRRRKIPKT